MLHRLLFLLSLSFYLPAGVYGALNGHIVTDFDDQPSYVEDFIEFHGAEEYHGITLEIKKNGVKQPATLIIMSDHGVVKEEVKLGDYESENDLHKMMQEKGFERKTEEEIEAMHEYYGSMPEDDNDDDDDEDDDDYDDDDEEEDDDDDDDEDEDDDEEDDD
eukprot:CAMPEP_0194133300 /NCGR_PEP_ID=MMETSP0152-20130528/3532_1 /TAXON_ID=1049557 /ORGANISM="Thalassiothrix antarctica, Strain L6-D1" /LENGTH=160 /DNA_ID=CAMNT_0038828595 /DNA_START=78 /DNA_END=557 /DNA_ORIENTATION=+